MLLPEVPAPDMAWQFALMEENSNDFGGSFQWPTASVSSQASASSRGQREANISQAHKET